MCYFRLSQSDRKGCLQYPAERQSTHNPCPGKRVEKRWLLDIKEAIENNRLLIISPFDDSVKRITQETANRRNEIMADLADEIFLAYYTEGGNLHNLIKSIKDKKIVVFD